MPFVRLICIILINPHAIQGPNLLRFDITWNEDNLKFPQFEKANENRNKIK